MAFRFREWPVYNSARAFRKEIKEKVLIKIPEEDKFTLGSQLKRALDSVVLNIAEGAYRRSDKDFAHFLNQSITSLYEVVSCLDLMADDGYISDNERKHFQEKAETIAKQLSAFIVHLNKNK